MKRLVAGTVAIILTSGVCRAAEQKAPGSEQDRLSYSIGYQVGSDFRHQGVDLTPEVVLQGLTDGLKENRSAIPLDEMRTILVDLKKKIVAGQTEQMKRLAARYRDEAQKFLTENARKEGVRTLESGLQYKVLKEGSGRKPTLKDTVTINYRATLTDGTEFDSTYRDGKPRSLPLGKVIPGLQEALPLMAEGAKWQLFLPPRLAFDDRGPLADRAVIYELELISVEPPK
ncbi:FKBP-type peptidyl-prolyl cis-trans isomerase [Geobacter sp.]|uniref:FKBP-type peptidyl-prolyl cis-trans isomerase N-terminal domain-containing protein n=1 Tax=Geobacter sp. TaxID=46610 RepID=UPI002601853C|nr:FKBP-type peptidyl-prolyl cis-trans isomerase [Geobacter sp.]